jgi:hypothetical protein
MKSGGVFRGFLGVRVDEEAGTQEAKVAFSSFYLYMILKHLAKLNRSKT